MMTNGSIGCCNALLPSKEKGIIEPKELEPNSEESVNAAENVIRSFYENVD